MWKTFIRRLLIMIPQLIGVTLIVFMLADIMPGDALTGQFSHDPTISAELEWERREAAGLNDPWPVQYVRWVGNMLQGDFGTSLQWHRPVTDLIEERLGNTVLLSTVSVIIIYSFAVPLGIIAGRYKGKTPEKIISFYNFIQLAFPSVVFAILLQWALALHFQWFPLRGSVDVRVMNDGWWAVMLSRLHHVILPALSIALVSGVGIIRFLSNEIHDQKNADYSTMARAKGVQDRELYTRHVLRNSILPIAASSGSVVVGLFSGAIIIENIFTFQGMGQLFVSSISIGDWPVVNFLVVFYASLTVLGFFISDLMLTLFDPRIRIK